MTARLPGAGNGAVTITADGPVTITNSAIGAGASTRATPGAKQPGGPQVRWDVGVITVLTEETRAVAGMLRRAAHYHAQDCPGGLRFEEAVLDPADARTRVVATRALEAGPLSAAHAFDHLVRYYAPAVIALTGIAGGIHSSLRLGDVVLAHDVVYYDHRKETPAGVRRRGASQRIPAPVRRAINNFFSEHGEPCTLTATSPDAITRTFRVFQGPIGSGDAVVADPDSGVRSYLQAYNDNTLALETEAGGLAQAFYEKAAASTGPGGWLAIRGISDLADAAKDDAWHDIASWHAAAVLELLAPYLKRASGP